MNGYNVSFDQSVNNVIEELYFEKIDGRPLNDTEKKQITNFDFSIIIEHQANSSNDLYIGICQLNANTDGTVWGNNTVVCSRQLTDATTQHMTFFPLSNRNNFNIRGYISIRKPAATLENFYAKKIRLTSNTTELSFWPKIKQFINSGTLYCDSELGRDNWPGTTIYPMKSISLALKCCNWVSVKAGCTYYENLHANGCKITSYGNGVKPVISGLKTIKNSLKPWQQGQLNQYGKWIKSTTGNIWRLDLTKTINFEQNSIIAGAGSSLNNIGTIIDIPNDTPCGARRVPKITDLNSNYDFWQQFNGKTTDYNTCNELYLYLNMNPNNLILGITSGGHGFEGNGKIAYIDFKYWGQHGLAITSNSRISGCNIDSIGGSVQLTVNNNSVGWVCYGNGIEIWVPYNDTQKLTENIRIQDCIVSRCYDAGITIQGNTGSRNPTNIIGKDLVFDNIDVTDCRYGIESFITIPMENTDGHNPTLNNCCFRNCSIINSNRKILFRRSRENGTEEPIEWWAVRMTSRYFTGLLIDKCNFSSPSFLLSLLDSNGEVSGFKMTQCTATVNPKDILLQYGYSNKDIIQLPIGISAYGQIIQKFFNLCPNCDIAFKY